MEFTEGNILAIAPDEGTGQRARGLAFPFRWLLLAGDGSAIWGLFGNPAAPFQVRADLKEIALGCTCPVRRKPCKHAIGLLLTFHRHNDAFEVAEPPEWVRTWMERRRKRAGSQEAVSPLRSEPNNTEKILWLQKQEKRLATMQHGLAELDSWLGDLLRQGLASIEARADEVCQGISQRLVDAKLGTLARRIRKWTLLMQQPDWPSDLLEEIGDLYLLRKGFGNLEKLPPALQVDLLTLAGAHPRKEELLQEQGVADRWLVAGLWQAEEDDNLHSRRTWLTAESTGRWAMLLDFAWGNTGFEDLWQPGTSVEAALVFYPSNWPLRAIVKTKTEAAEACFTPPGCYADFDAFADVWAAALGQLPWLRPFPACFGEVVPLYHQGRFVLADRRQLLLPLTVEADAGWRMLALSAGSPIHLFGQWEGRALRPLSLFHECRWYVIAER